MARTLYVKQRDAEKLHLSDFPNAGPNPCISGMKKYHWGKEALCIRSGAYAYKVDEETYRKAQSFHL